MLTSCAGDCCCEQKESYHTHLAVRYLELVLSLRNLANTDKNQLQEARSVISASDF